MKQKIIDSVLKWIPLGFILCSGSGTTAIACLKTNRKYICIEKDTEYFEKSVSRVELFKNNKT